MVNFIKLNACYKLNISKVSTGTVRIKVIFIRSDCFMLGKIVELSGIALENGFEVIYGIDMYQDGRRNFGFVSIVSGTCFSQTRVHVNYMYSYCLRKEQDLFKEYIIGTDKDPWKLQRGVG